MKNIKIHPIAELFPMMTSDELQDLASDIQAHGLLQPIVVDDSEQVVDGRNRLACRIAKIEPKFEKLDGRDPVAFIFSANLARRHLTKGQHAMITAMIYPEPEKGGRGKKSQAAKSAETSGFSIRRVEQARSVMRHSRKLAEDVIKGSATLDEALEVVKDQQQKASSQKAKLERLRKGAPDLADRVADEKLSVDEATAIFLERERTAREIRQAGISASQDLPGFAVWVASISSALEVGQESLDCSRHFEIDR
jgi:ParB-like nuclease domain